MTHIRAPIVEKVGKMLAQWIEHQQLVTPLFTMITQNKAIILSENLNVIEPDLKVKSFAESAGWFECSKGHHRFHNPKLIVEAAAADLGAAEKFSVLLHVTTACIQSG
jgi:hypothetical protein